MMHLPASLRPSEDSDERADREGLRGTTTEERGAILESLCRMAAEQTAQHADPARVLRWQDPISPEAAATLAALRRRYRRNE